MTSFDKFELTGANIARYLPIYGNASKMIGAYRKFAEPHKKYESTPLGVGQVPLFLLDGELTASMLDKAKKTLKMSASVVLYRPYDVKLLGCGLF